MDPDIALTEIRRLREQISRDLDPRNYSEADERDVTRLLDLTESLDSWLSNGGFLPKAWRKP